MRALVLLLLLAPSLAQAAELREVRVLVLDAYGEGLSDAETKLLGDTVLNAFRGKDGVLIASSKQVRARSPLLADRIDGCDTELCLYEAGDAILAEFVVFATARVTPEGRSIHLGVFETEAGEIVVDERVDGASVGDALASIQGAMERVLAPILVGTRPNLFEQPAFLTGAGLLFLGTMTTVGGFGWAAEMDLALAEPGRHRDQKQFALDNGHRALWVGGFGLGITAVGAAVLGWAVSE